MARSIATSPSQAMPSIGGASVTPGRLARTPSHGNDRASSGAQALELLELAPHDYAWFLIDSGKARQSLHWFEREPIEFARETDFDTLIGKYRAYMRFSLGWSDWRFIYGNNPS